MTAKKDSSANRLVEWAETAQPGDTYTYWTGPVGESHDRVFGRARALADGLFALFTRGQDRQIVRLSDRAKRFLKSAASW